MLEPSETPLILFALLPKILATVAFRKPHLKEKLQAWNLTEARAKAFKMFNAMLAPWFNLIFFPDACIYLHIETENRFIFIQNSQCGVQSFHLNSSVSISPNIHHEVSNVGSTWIGPYANHMVSAGVRMKVDTDDTNNKSVCMTSWAAERFGTSRSATARA